MDRFDADVLIIGAGPAGSMAANLLIKQGLSVLILEKERFPRFSIGESLLPQSIGLLEEAGMLQAVVEAGFQYKNGAAFAKRGLRTDFDFREKFGAGWGNAYQVERAVFDKVLADEASKTGAEIRFGHEITAIDVGGGVPRLSVKGPEGAYEVSGRYLLDASGFGRILQRKLGLETPSGFPSRRAVFTHVEDRIALGSFDRNKILVTVHPEHKDVWYWLIPFSNGRCSLGVVADAPFLDKYLADPTAGLKALHWEDEGLKVLLKDAVWDTPARTIVGFSANVKSLWGDGYALLGNAGEFLDPVFSSGVTIAFKSASLAAPLVARQLKGGTVDWETEYAQPLKKGVDAFRAFVESWYRGGFQDVIFYKNQEPAMRKMICSVLAGYAWDQANPFVAEPRRLALLEEFCAA
jgi:flavin-dependent dehydrogenase